ncbi:MAG: hypothetical protein ABEH83_06115 [Halobacterium sp.]
MADDETERGGEPEVIVGCTACQNTYPAQRTADGEYRPIGTDGTCECGSTEFERIDGD